MQDRLRASCILLFSAFIWAVAFIPTRYLGTIGVSVFTEILVRYATPFFYFLFFFPAVWKIRSISALQSFCNGCILWAALACAIYGVRKIEYGSLGILLMTSYVLLVPLTTAIINKKIPSIKLLLCSIFTLLAIGALVVGKPLGTPNLGTFLCIFSSFLFTVYLIFSSHILKQGISTYSLHFYQSLGCIIPSLPLVFLIQPELTLNAFILHNTPALWLSLAFSGFLSGLVAYQGLFYAQKILPNIIVAIILAMKNVFSAVCDIVIFHAPFTLLHCIAYAVVIICATIASLDNTQ